MERLDMAILGICVLAGAFLLRIVLPWVLPRRYHHPMVFSTPRSRTGKMKAALVTGMTGVACYFAWGVLYLLFRAGAVRLSGVFTYVLWAASLLCGIGLGLYVWDAWTRAGGRR